VYSNGTTTIPLTGLTVTNPSSISGTLTIPAGATVGYYNITVTNPDAKTVTRASRFRVLDNAPTVSRITNRTGYSGWMVIENITGTNFVSGSTAGFVNGISTINPASCTYVSSTRLFCTYDLTGIEASATNGYRVLVSNPDGKTATLANYFTVSNPTPVISASTPSTGVQGDLVTITSLSGTYFQPGATVTYWQG
jgi:predicted SnoaL-like aldol condensation-catalyzing enzyme